MVPEWMLLMQMTESEREAYTATKVMQEGWARIQAKLRDRLPKG